MSEENLLDETKVSIEKIAKAIHKRCKSLKNEDETRLEAQEDRWMEVIENRTIENAEEFDKKVLVVVVTPKTENAYKDSEEYQKLEKLMYLNSVSSADGINLNLDVHIVSENKTGLPEVYNRFITPEYEDYYVCFIHDDVLIDDVDVFQKLQQAHRKAEIVGVAGATKIALPFEARKPTLWHTLSANPEVPAGSRVGHFQSGTVFHPAGEGVYASAFGASPQICRLIDGLFMSFDVSKCLRYKFQFDERFTFHHYDLSACLIAAKCGLNITTWPISVTHRSKGNPNNQEWMLSHNKFVQIYKDFR